MIFPRGACQKKNIYATKEQVRAVRNERQHKSRERLYAYKCETCIGFHLTRLKPPPEVIV